MLLVMQMALHKVLSALLAVQGLHSAVMYVLAFHIVLSAYSCECSYGPSVSGMTRLGIPSLSSFAPQSVHFAYCRAS